MEQPAGDRRGKMQKNVDIVESRRNGPQPSMRHDDDDKPKMGRLVPIAAPLSLSTFIYNAADGPENVLCKCDLSV